MFILMSVCDFPFPLFESKPEYCMFVRFFNGWLFGNICPIKGT